MPHPNFIKINREMWPVSGNKEQTDSALYIRMKPVNFPEMSLDLPLEKNYTHAIMANM